MKRNLFTLLVILLLVLSISVPVFADSQAVRVVHWSQKYIDELSVEHDIALMFQGKDLNSFITYEDFQKIIRLVIDEQYDGKPDSVLREAVVYEFTKLWAEKSGLNLDEIATIKMLIYIDTHEIDPKYNHAITIAYMKDIARGRGKGIFDPKTKTTYGELATLVYFTDKAIKAETKPEIPSIAAGKLETRVSYEIKNDKVVFDFELFSHYAQPKELTFSSGQQYEVVISDESGNEVYRYSDGKFFTMALVNKTINPGESFKWQDEWDMTDKKGVKLTTGNYKAVINILAMYSAEGEKIDDSEFTATIEFNLNSGN